METLKTLYKIGVGPSSSHTYGPKVAAAKIKELYPTSTKIVVTLYGSLALTGIGHLTDYIICKTLDPIECEFIYEPIALDYHPNGMKFDVYQDDCLIDSIVGYSIGGGKVEMDGISQETIDHVYPHQNMSEIIAYIEEKGISFYDYILEFEDDDIEEYLYKVLDAMFYSVKQGLCKEGIIPGRLKLQRVAKSMHSQALKSKIESEKERLFISSYAYAVSEENASGQVIVTAPTCGASGVLPAVLYYAYKHMNISKANLVQALGVGGLFGNVIKHNATISGADGGCQAEIGSACSMAAASFAWLLQLDHSLIEYAAEMGMEHNLGLTCDPVGGYVQIPCIERNGFGALRSVDAALYAKQLGLLRKNKISFDSVVQVMHETGKDLKVAYKETALGGLASHYHFDDTKE